MRIIAGALRGHRISAPQGASTRPTSDRVREALFSSVYSLAGDLDKAEVLDLYAGSGALGLEALSRGAAHCTFVDSDPRAVAAIGGNVQRLKLAPGTVTVLHSACERLSARSFRRPPVSLLLADPPYRIDASEFSQVLEALASEGLLAAHALVVYEHAAARDMIWPHAFTPEPVRRYGDTAVSFATYEG